MVLSIRTARECCLIRERYKSLRATVGNYPDPVNWGCGVCSSAMPAATSSYLALQLLLTVKFYMADRSLPADLDCLSPSQLSQGPARSMSCSGGRDLHLLKYVGRAQAILFQWELMWTTMI